MLGGAVKLFGELGSKVRHRYLISETALCQGHHLRLFRQGDILPYTVVSLPSMLIISDSLEEGGDL